MDSSWVFGWKVGMKINLTIYGQIKSGKNKMQIARTGRHYPLKAWAEWRDNVVANLEVYVYQSGIKFPINEPCRVEALYWKGDRRRRDVPGMMDALWHCLERAKIVTDDKLFEDVTWIMKGLDRKNPRVEIKIEMKV